MSRFLAIDADVNGLVVTAATLKGRTVVLEHAVADGGEARPLSPASAPALGARLKEILRRDGIRPAPVLVCFGRDRIILKDVRHPPTAPVEEPAVVRFQAVKDLTESPDDVVMDYAPVDGGAPTADGEKRALAVFVRKEMVQAARILCDAAGLKLAAVSPRPFAAVAAARYELAAGTAHQPPEGGPGAVIAVVSLWGTGGEFTVARGADVALSRTVSAQSHEDPRGLAGELKRNLAAYDGQNPTTPVRALYICEADAPGGWADHLRAALPVPVYTLDPLAAAPAAATDVPEAARGRFVGPIGLLAGWAAADAVPINFAAPRQPRPEKGPGPRRVIMAAVAAALVFAVGGVIGYLELDKADQELAALKTHKEELDQELQSHELDAKRLAAADDFSGREIPWLDELYDLADRVPDVSKLSVTEMNGVALAPPKPAQKIPGQAPPPKEKVGPVAALSLTMRTADDKLAQRVQDAFTADKFYANTSRTIGGLNDAAAKGQQFVLNTQVLHRKPKDYTRHLVPPPAPAPRGGFGGGFGGGVDDFEGGFGP
ncbi:type IV pilus biogenesis protein PilM [Fimbriiglobus ruber]|uniref:Type IV pilus biogenesis protein PilM n=1 Tax=Fimbriiglobus ruber TaxID=1908690 RepID=A0A225E834_9BACT|nr:hypothetical protein [Fimbriiglobus ruber]OWK45669.1 hypothetical protein FRUB_02000 [Fimbriiglobus ruber]